MKKLLYFILAAAALTACTDELIPDALIQEENLVFTARISNTQTRTNINRATGKVSWEEGDIIRINGTEYLAHPDGTDPALATFTVKDETSRGAFRDSDGKFNATYGSAGEQIYDPDGANCPMSAVSTTTELNFTNDCGVLRINVNADGVSVIRVRTDGYGIVCDPAVDISTAKDFYLAVPAGEYKNFKIRFYTSGNLTSTKTFNGTLTVVKNEIQPVTFSAPLEFVASSEQLDGIFSVSPYDKVQFSPGILQYQASTGDWRFAKDQLSFIGDNPGNSVKSGRETQSDWIDQFGWGATGFNEYGQKPYANGNNNSVYKTQASNASTEMLTIENKADWGYAYSVANGVTGWYTMSWPEWDYLLFNRPASTVNNVANARYALIIVNGTNGVLVFPDEFTWDNSTMGTPPASINSGNSSWNGTDYTLDQFEAMEAEGAVFMPATGYIRPDGYQQAGTMGSHWTSTTNGANNAVTLDFGSGTPASCNSNRYTRCTVRLVKKLPEPAEKTEPLPGVFSLSVVEKAQFAPGNLQYQASTDSWRFAKDQISYFGQCPGNSTTTGRETQRYWIDLFGWGSSGYNADGAKPYTFSTDNALYKTRSVANATEKLTLANMADWGYAYNIGHDTEGWFTMTDEQLLYLINTRAASTVNGTENARYACVIIRGIRCLALFPDQFEWDNATMGTAPATINMSESSWNTTNYTYAQYLAMEAAGMVFLPAAGYYNTSFQNINTYGAYWTRSASSATNAFSLDFNGSGPRSGHPDRYESNRRDHSAVRLVRLAVNPGGDVNAGGQLSDFPTNDLPDE